MTFKAFSLAAGAASFSRTLWALPAFFVVTLIPWLLAAHALVLSRDFSARGARLPGIAFKIAAIALAGFTVLSTLWFLVVWVLMLVRCLRGLEEVSGNKEAQGQIPD